jgi:hypothetical protein
MTAWDPIDMEKAAYHEAATPLSRGHLACL